ncbi:hypothetical protein ACHMW6_28495 [Pseudoduganella sp. UC29_106]|uniref:hypothetical protein n=1 Tax=Pseudoduganella sp. UC29_106 TaxID=3374553 RepID=UPI003757C0FB
MRKLLVFALSLLLAGCVATTPSLPSDNRISPSFRQPPAGSLIVLLPAEVEAAELESGIAILMNALHQRLLASGYKVVKLDQDSHDAIWSQEVKDVGGIYDPNTGALRRHELMLVLGHLVQRVSAETSAAMVIRPRLVLRSADISGASAAWDGQQRRVPVYGAGGDTVRGNGSTLGLSVGLDIFASSGEMVMRTHGGALLPYRANVKSGKNEVRSDLFENESEVADGVAIALAPLLKL